MKKMSDLFLFIVVVTALYSPVSLWATCFKSSSVSCHDESKAGEQILTEKNDLFAVIGKVCAQKLVMANVPLPDKTVIYFFPRKVMKTTIAQALKIYASGQGASEVRTFEKCQIFPVFQDESGHNMAASDAMVVTIQGDQEMTSLEDLHLPYPLQHQRMLKIHKGARVHVLDLEGDLKAHVAKVKKAIPEAKVELSLVSEYIVRLGLK